MYDYAQVVYVSLLLLPLQLSNLLCLDLCVFFHQLCNSLAQERAFLNPENPRPAPNLGQTFFFLGINTRIVYHSNSLRPVGPDQRHFYHVAPARSEHSIFLNHR